MENQRAITFSPGPSQLPVEVLLTIQKELLNYNGVGISVLELSHRSSHFAGIIDGARNLVRELLNVPENYRILFLSGGSMGQFSAIPINLMITGEADYVVTGTWSSKAAKEAAKYGKVNKVFQPLEKFTTVPDESTWTLSSNASYLFYCDNETIDGVEFDFIPTSDCPIVCDMSSNMFTKTIDVTKFGVIFACAQKNFGCAGVTMVIIREDLLARNFAKCPSIWDYKLQDSNQSLLNTPDTFSLYVSKLVLEWLKSNGGIETMEELSKIKSKAVYDLVDASNGFYRCPVEPRYRSRMNIPFRAGFENPTVEKEFIQASQKAGLLDLKGHRSVGGLRASLYNAISLENTMALVKFMEEFKAKY